jgi:predicted DNA-binding ribbon-helix-helix protein
MSSAIRKRSIVVKDHKTSISLEDAFFSALKEIAKQRHSTLSEIIAEVDQARSEGNLSSALRLFVLNFYRSTASHSRP